MPRRLKHLRNVFLFVLAGIMLIGCFGFGQWKISGYVTDDADNPLAGVTVVIKAKKTVTVTTGEDGKWSAAVAGDEAEITAVKEGFEFEPVVVKKASNKPVTIVGRPKLTINPASGYYEEAITVELAIAGIMQSTTPLMAVTPQLRVQNTQLRLRLKRQLLSKLSPLIESMRHINKN